MTTATETLRVYRGAANHDIHDRMFFSSCPDFARDYGEVREYEIQLHNVFDTLDPDQVGTILPLHDSYDGTDIKTIEAYLARSSDTWEMVENKDFEGSLPGDVVVISEGGVTNYLVKRADLVTLIQPAPIPK